jgi:DNA helicase-2/ATP-dependent DNA helicase PcrA
MPRDLVTAQTMYRHELHQQSYFDFTEVLRTAADLLEEEPDHEVAGALIRHVRDTIRYVVVDEYQDTNPDLSRS